MAAQQTMAPAAAPTLANLTADDLARAIAKATLEVQQATNPIENRNPPKTSVFNPSGGPRPRLKRETIFCGAPQEEGNLKNEEIELLNQVEPGFYHQGKWEVRRTVTGTGKETIDIRLPVAEVDDRMEIPHTLTLTIQEILREGVARKSAAQS
jgi:hypothetical protein